MPTDPRSAAVAAANELLRTLTGHVVPVPHRVSEVDGQLACLIVVWDARQLMPTVVDERRRVLAGATFCGVDVSEWLHAATVAVVAEVPVDKLWHAVPSFPTRSEVWLRLFEAYGL